MQRDKGTLARPGFLAFVCCLGLALFCWPLLVSPDYWIQPYSFYFLFAAWGLICLLLVLVSRSLSPRLPREPGAPRLPWLGRRRRET